MGQKNGKVRLSQDEVRCYKRSVSFSDTEIQDWFTEFKSVARQQGGNYYLTEKEFESVYNKVYPGDSADYCKHIFRTFDKNGDGKVNFEEFLVGLNVSGSDNIKKILKWTFDVYDVNRSGCISKPEMEEIVKAVYKMLDPKRVRMPEEFKTPSQVVEHMFTAMDSNKDENLTWQEFYDGVNKDAFLVNLLQCNSPDYVPDEEPVFES